MLSVKCFDLVFASKSKSIISIKLFDRRNVKKIDENVLKLTKVLIVHNQKNEILKRIELNS